MRCLIKDAPLIGDLERKEKRLKALHPVRIKLMTFLICSLMHYNLIYHGQNKTNLILASTNK